MGTGRYVPYCQIKGPFSWRRPSRDEQPGYKNISKFLMLLLTSPKLTPPFSHINISSPASAFSDGKNQKYNSLVSFALFEIGSKPAYDSPISKLTSGIAVPLTENSEKFGKFYSSFKIRQTY